MKQRKYTLPRHTNLAKLSSRTGAFLIDVAILGALFIGFHFGVTQFIFSPIAQPYEIELATEKVNSHLRIETEDGKIVPFYKEDSTFEGYRDAISYFYMNYLTGDVEVAGTGSRLANEKIKNESGELVSKKDYYTVDWFNRNIFGLGVEDPDSLNSLLFTYPKVEGVYDRTQLGIPKDPSVAPVEDVIAYMQEAYTAASDDFNSLSYIKDIRYHADYIHMADFVLAGMIASAITYIVFPLIFKQGRTVGKKVFKVALASSDGYVFLNRFLPMRYLPLAVMILSFLIPNLYSNLLRLILIPLIIFLISFAIAMASPKRTALHDFTGRTIVIDDKTSIIFVNEMEEEQYLLKEDNLLPSEPNEDGEEPELSYEK